MLLSSHIFPNVPHTFIPQTFQNKRRLLVRILLSYLAFLILFFFFPNIPLTFFPKHFVVKEDTVFPQSPVSSYFFPSIPLTFLPPSISERTLCLHNLVSSCIFSKQSLSMFFHRLFGGKRGLCICIILSYFHQTFQSKRGLLAE